MAASIVKCGIGILLFSLMGSEVKAEELPSRGSCILPDLFYFTQIEWDPDGSAGIVIPNGISLRAEMVGMRPHVDGFKVSFRFLDPILHLPTELVLMDTVLLDEPRAALVRFEQVGEEKRVLHSVYGFHDVVCIYR